MFKIDLILKEWSAIFSFFELKKYCIIFRKGGIHEKEFLEIESYFGIFKTHEHESIETLKPSCKSFLTNSTVEYTGTFDLEYIAKIKKSYLVDSFEKLEILDEFSPWNIDYLKDRFNFKPKNPLYCYFLELRKLKIPEKVLYIPEEAKGCKSWFKPSSEIKVYSTSLINDSMNENRVYSKIGV